MTIRSYPSPIPVSMDDSIDEYEDEEDSMNRSMSLDGLFCAGGDHL